mmetsp:Transcript_9646/g.16694  ORF Transcript_9646/g.16694 Transcript_9646/m.16694 type:complete len:215 (+) Transcript_9646:659-1303(+)
MPQHTSLLAAVSVPASMRSLHSRSGRAAGTEHPMRRPHTPQHVCASTCSLPARNHPPSAVVYHTRPRCASTRPLVCRVLWLCLLLRATGTTCTSPHHHLSFSSSDASLVCFSAAIASRALRALCRHGASHFMVCAIILHVLSAHVLVWDGTLHTIPALVSHVFPVVCLKPIVSVLSMFRLFLFLPNASWLGRKFGRQVRFGGNVRVRDGGRAPT